MRVLVVDDDEDFLDVLLAIFRAEGIDMVACTSGAQALRRLDEEQFDVVVLDLVMPVMNGRAVARHIRERSRHADLPVVMMTSMSNVPKIGSSPGYADHFVNKSGEPGALIRLINSLSGRRAHRPGP